MNASGLWLRNLITGWVFFIAGLLAVAGEPAEYRLKAAVLYNFARYTEWPPDTGPTLTLCILGRDPFGPAIDAMQGKLVGTRELRTRRLRDGDSPLGCQVLFIARSAETLLPGVVELLRDRPTLIVADTPGAARQGAALNMITIQGKVRFEANLAAARAAGLQLGSNLLQLATLVIQ
ncbi:MAG: YfiR family protein [Pseudomonadota bacterium]